jgi:hypothetical protein
MIVPLQPPCLFVYRGFFIATFDYQSENHDDRIWDMKWSTQHGHTKSVYRMFNLPFSLCWGLMNIPWSVQVHHKNSMRNWPLLKLIDTVHIASSMSARPVAILGYARVCSFWEKHIIETYSNHRNNKREDIVLCVGPKRPNQGLSNSWTQHSQVVVSEKPNPHGCENHFFGPAKPCRSFKQLQWYVFLIWRLVNFRQLTFSWMFQNAERLATCRAHAGTSRSETNHALPVVCCSGVPCRVQ